MKAKEEAEKLIEQFMKPIDKLHNYPMCFDTAKQCAIIAVDEMIEQVKKFKFMIHHEYEIMYLNRVKQEIEKL